MVCLQLSLACFCSRQNLLLASYCHFVSVSLCPLADGGAAGPCCHSRQGQLQQRGSGAAQVCRLKHVLFVTFETARLKKKKFPMCQE